MMEEIGRASRCTLCALAIVAWAGCHAFAAEPQARPDASARAAALDESLLPIEVRRLSLKEIGGLPAFSLRSTESSTTMAFGGRYDELITAATLKLRYTYSPSLIPAQSHIKVFINDEIVGVAPITREDSGRGSVHEMVIDPRVIADFNRLKLQSVAHFAQECEDPLNSTLWTEVSGSSELVLTVRPIVLPSDLALLPEPFFDKRDLKRLRLPFVFATHPSPEVLRAAGIAASWFGQLAAWRGARFPVQLGQPPRGHGIVVATNARRPPFLAGLAPVEGPTLSIVTNPADGYSKLLLILGRDGSDLKAAADALVLGSAALSGAQVLVREVKALVPRKPYDAPNWVKSDRPTKLGELIDSADELQAVGHAPDFIRVKLRIPPDLFTWRSRGVPVVLRYRYTARPARAGDSMLEMAINGELVRSFPLKPLAQDEAITRVRTPLLDDSLLSDEDKALVPAFKLGSRNELQLGFSFAVNREGGCRSTQLESVRAMVDPDSSMDFSGFPHYTALPHLGYFATAGFPFTKYADLSQTVVVLPRAPTAADIEALLTVLGRMGESTGYPAVGVRVAGPDDEAMLRNADLLVIGASPQQSLLDKWSERLPARISGQNRTVSQPVRDASSLYDWVGFRTRPDPSVLTRVSVEGSGPLAALLGFESPVSSARSVVAITAVAPEHLGQVLDALENPGRVRAMHGSAVFVHPLKVESVLAGNVYYVGDLPFWAVAWFHLSAHPVLLTMLTVVMVSLFAWVAAHVLEGVRRRRTEEGR
jgi:cellulose synthase operon protein B